MQTLSENAGSLHQPETIADVVRKQLARILRSPGFLSSKKRSQFLSHIVEAKLKSRSDELKEYVLGIEVFGRPESFDPRIDSVVRVYATDVRKRLREYYRTHGRFDPLRIDLPPGGYVPRFEFLRPREVAPEPPNPQLAFDAGAILRPVIAVLCITLEPGEDSDFCYGVADELITALAAIEGIEVLAGSYTLALASDRLLQLPSAFRVKVTAFLEITARRSEGIVRVTTRLFNPHTCCVTWAQHFELEVKDTLTAQNRIAKAITAAFSAALKDGTAGLWMRQSSR